jgi:hypothetical protein
VAHSTTSATLAWDAVVVVYVLVLTIGFAVPE